MKIQHIFSKQPPARLLGACLAVVLSGMAFTVHAIQTPPERMTYQGFLVEEDGTPLGQNSPENYDVVFSIFKDQTGGDAIWAEQQTVTVDKGYFSVLLGEGADELPGGSPSLPDVFTGEAISERYVEITVNGIGPGSTPVAIQPRLRLVSSPYAFLATRASALMDDAGEDMVTSSGSGITVAGAVSATSVTAPTVNGTTVGATTVNATTVNAITVNANRGNGIIPLGGIIMWAGNTAPAGWALCNGQQVNGWTTPNLRDRFIVGAGQSYAAHFTGGANSVTLSAAQMPQHRHSGYTNTDGAHQHTGNSHSWADNDDNDGPAVYLRSSTYHGAPGGGGVASTGSSHRHYITTSYVGSNGSHENRPPYYALAFIMRVQ